MICLLEAMSPDKERKSPMTGMNTVSRRSNVEVEHSAESLRLSLKNDNLFY